LQKWLKVRGIDKAVALDYLKGTTFSKRNGKHYSKSFNTDGKCKPKGNLLQLLVQLSLLSKEGHCPASDNDWQNYAEEFFCLQEIGKLASCLPVSEERAAAVSRVNELLPDSSKFDAARQEFISSCGQERAKLLQRAGEVLQTWAKELQPDRFLLLLQYRQQACMHGLNAQLAFPVDRGTPWANSSEGPEHLRTLLKGFGYARTSSAYPAHLALDAAARAAGVEAAAVRKALMQVIQGQFMADMLHDTKRTSASWQQYMQGGSTGATPSDGDLGFDAWMRGIAIALRKASKKVEVLYVCDPGASAVWAYPALDGHFSVKQKLRSGGTGRLYPAGSCLPAYKLELGWDMFPKLEEGAVVLWMEGDNNSVFPVISGAAQGSTSADTSELGELQFSLVQRTDRSFVGKDYSTVIQCKTLEGKGGSTRAVVKSVTVPFALRPEWLIPGQVCHGTEPEMQWVKWQGKKLNDSDLLSMWNEWIEGVAFDQKRTAPLSMLEHPELAGIWRALGSMRTDVNFRKVVIYSLHRRMLGAPRSLTELADNTWHNPMELAAACESLYEAVDASYAGTNSTRYRRDSVSQLARYVIPKFLNELQPSRYEEFCVAQRIPLFGITSITDAVPAVTALAAAAAAGSAASMVGISGASTGSAAATEPIPSTGAAGSSAPAIITAAGLVLAPVGGPTPAAGSAVSHAPAAATGPAPPVATCTAMAAAAAACSPVPAAAAAWSPVPAAAAAAWSPVPASEAASSPVPAAAAACSPSPVAAAWSHALKVSAAAAVSQPPAVPTGAAPALATIVGAVCASEAVAVHTASAAAVALGDGAASRHGDANVAVQPAAKKRRLKKEEPVTISDDEDEVVALPWQDGAACSSGTKLSVRYQGFKAVYPCQEGPSTVQVLPADLDQLADEQFLNDTNVDFYMRYVMEGLSADQKARCFFYNSFFYTKLTQQVPDLKEKPQDVKDKAKHERVKKWTKDHNIFEDDYLFIPVHGGLHWTLVIVCYPGRLAVNNVGSSCSSGASPGSGVVQGMPLDGSTVGKGKTPCILHLDSMAGGHPSAPIFKVVRAYLQHEWARKHSPQECKPHAQPVAGLEEQGLEGIAVTSKTMPALRLTTLPKQENHYDCGLFMLTYLEYFIHGGPGDVDINALKSRSGGGNSGQFLQQEWVPGQVAGPLRAHLRCLIYEHMLQQAPTEAHGSAAYRSMQEEVDSHAQLPMRPDARYLTPAQFKLVACEKTRGQASNAQNRNGTKQIRQQQRGRKQRAGADAPRNIGAAVAASPGNGSKGQDCQGAMGEGPGAEAVAVQRRSSGRRRQAPTGNDIWAMGDVLEGLSSDSEEDAGLRPAKKQRAAQAHEDLWEPDDADLRAAVTAGGQHMVQSRANEQATLLGKRPNKPTITRVPEGSREWMNAPMHFRTK